MIWIFGGAFESGAAIASLYDYRLFVQKTNTIVVAINHRLAAFGFAVFSLFLFLLFLLFSLAVVSQLNKQTKKGASIFPTYSCYVQHQTPLFVFWAVSAC